MSAEPTNGLVIRYETTGVVVPIRAGDGAPAWLTTSPVRLLALDARGVVHDVWEAQWPSIVRVADGAPAPEGEPLGWGSWGWGIRLPPGVEATVELEGFEVGEPYLRMNEGLGFARETREVRRLPHVEAFIRLRWVGGELAIPASLFEPLVFDGQVVRDGDRIATGIWTPGVSLPRSRCRLHDLLHSTPPDHPALLSTVTGEVVEVDETNVLVRDSGGRVTSHPTGDREPVVWKGKTVSQGDALTHGSRDHRDLHAIWDAETMRAHLGEELREALGERPSSWQIAQLARAIVDDLDRR